MANLHYEFGMFHGRIALTHSRMATLKHVREEIRDHLSLYFLRRLGLAVPEFHDQGAFATRTVIDPISGEYAIDDGICLQHLDCRNMSRWPEPEMVHMWVVEAARIHAESMPLDRQTFVRVACAGQYHIDLRIYAELKGRLYLAECGGTRGWHRNDPLALTQWFSSAVKRQREQLPRIVRYLKAWSDFQSASRGNMPGGLILSVYAVRNFVPQDRDDVALLHTFQSLQNDVEALVYLLNPVNLDEELTAPLSEARKQRFQQAVHDAAEDALEAVESHDRQHAANLWRKQFGDRFPCAAA